ncbi:hypothetical protein Zmor_003771 [Zophobas morio]|uniref:Uncharacterized protein n=1 Tax=Zophobas morio TaxID=2755281 RepID=A0AA38M2Y5_9CUCU|nr:hypothetical protein Zmor_003771 [Zophobas morio]
MFAKSFSEAFVCEPPTVSSTVYSPSNTDQIINVVVTETAVYERLKRLNIATSPGPDNISANVLNNCTTSLCKPLSFLMNQSLDSGVLPLDWRTATVKLIYKSGDKFDPANYRPISLTSLVVKTVEAIIYEKTLDFLQKHKIIP